MERFLTKFWQRKGQGESGGVGVKEHMQRYTNQLDEEETQ